MKHTRLLIKRPDGRYLDQGFDCADRWVVDPADATPMSHYERESDTNEYRHQGCIVVEFSVTLAPTGRTCADLFKEERAASELRRAEEAEEQRIATEKARLHKEAEGRILALTLGITPTSESGA